MASDDQFCEETREQVARMREKDAEFEARLRAVENKLEKACEKLDALLVKLNRYEGKLGGMLMAAAALIAFFKFVAVEGTTWLSKLFGGA